MLNDTNDMTANMKHYYRRTAFEFSQALDNNGTFLNWQFFDTPRCHWCAYYKGNLIYTVNSRIMPSGKHMNKAEIAYHEWIALQEVLRFRNALSCNLMNHEEFSALKHVLSKANSGIDMPYKRSVLSLIDYIARVEDSLK